MQQYKKDDLLGAHDFMLVMEEYIRNFLRYREDKGKTNHARYPKAMKQKQWWREFREWEEQGKAERLTRLGLSVGTCDTCGSTIDVDTGDKKNAG